MTLPQRLPKKHARSERWRSPAHLNFIRSHHCCVPGCDQMPIQAAHVRRGSDAGTGRKPSDYFAVSLCWLHHAIQHSIGEETFERQFGIDLHALALEFAQASPKRAEIARARQDQHDG